MSDITWADLVEKLPASALSTIALSVQTEILATVHEIINATRLGGEGSYRVRRARMLLHGHRRRASIHFVLSRSIARMPNHTKVRGQTRPAQNAVLTSQPRTSTSTAVVIRHPLR